MKILFTRFPLESSFGGAEVQTLSLMKGLVERGHVVEFLGSCPTLVKEVSSIKCQVSHLNIGVPPVTKWSAVSFFWRRFTMQKKLIASLKEVDAIFMLSLSEKLLLTDFAVTKGIKVFWVEHDTIGPWLRSNPWLPTLRHLSAKATTICVSELSRKIYVHDLHFPSTRVITIPNGVDRPGSEHAPHPSTFHLGCVARLSYEKGVDVLVQAVRDIPEASLTIVGTGKQEGYLRSLIAEIEAREGAPCRVNIVHRVPAIADFYTSINALVLPSIEHDPFGLVAAEAMMLGIPVVVTDACGIAGYLKHQSDALIATAGSSESLAECVHLLLDPAARAKIGAAGQRTAEATFSMKRMVDAYAQLL